jgi:uncharacterized linocin/CFP29 family protein
MNEASRRTMDPALENCGWTDEHWNRICTAVSEEAQKARVAAQMLPLVGPVEPSTVAVPSYLLQVGPRRVALGPPPGRLEVDSDPTLYITTLAINVSLRTGEVSDPELNAAMVMFRRAATYMARLEDLLVFGGRPAPGVLLTNTPANVPLVWTATGDGSPDGLFVSYSGLGALRNYTPLRWMPPYRNPPTGDQVINGIIDSINLLDAAGQLGPYACALSQDLFAAICTPSNNLVLPRDRILPFLQGPLLRASTIRQRLGVVVATSANPVELVVASDIGVRFLQATEEPRYVFRVSERVALRIKEHRAIGILFY